MPQRAGASRTAAVWCVQARRKDAHGAAGGRGGPRHCAAVRSWAQGLPALDEYAHACSVHEVGAAGW